jgi:hypothetical protein
MKAGLLLASCVGVFAAVGCQAKKETTGRTNPGDAPTAPAAPAAPAQSRGSRAATQPQDRLAPPRRILGLEEGWELAPTATYTASQTPTEVIIKATGEHSTAGYQTKLVMSPLRIYPPQWMLAQKKPAGAVAQVITEFEVTASFKASEPIKAVHVTDAAGKHVVPVDQARGLTIRHCLPFPSYRV